MIANVITSCRILISVLMFLFSVFSPGFYVCYLIAGISVHSLANKIIGAVLFVLPLTMSVIDVKYSAAFACLVATFAAIQEGHIIRSYSSEIDRVV